MLTTPPALAAWFFNFDLALHSNTQHDTPALAEWFFNFDLALHSNTQHDTTGFSRVVPQLSPKVATEKGRRHEAYETIARRKLRHHAPKFDGTYLSLKHHG